jgi:hypothetical protein
MWGRAPLVDCALFRPTLLLAIANLMGLGALAWLLAMSTQLFMAVGVTACAIAWIVIWLVPYGWKPPIDPIELDNVVRNT